MEPLKLWNDRVEILVSRQGVLSVRLTQGGQEGTSFALREGQVQVRGAEWIRGLYYHDMPCCFESLEVREEGMPEPIAQRAVGTWPVDIDDDQLEMYPQLHYLERRKTGLPWRYERWYSLVGTFLVFESEQYFERSRPRGRGKNWARFIVQLRQVANLDSEDGKAAVLPHSLLESPPSGRDQDLS